jgi:hypothetical protein
MQGDVAIGVGRQAFLEFDRHAAQHQLPAIGETVRIVTMTYS